MKTNLATCSNEELRELDTERGYTAISNQVAFDVLLNPKLGQASRLWMYFRFQQSGFENKTYIQKTYYEIADAFSVSKSTIKNWAYKLRNLGYLEIIEEKQDRLNNFPNKFRVCLPKRIHENIKNINSGYLPVNCSKENDSQKTSVSLVTETKPEPTTTSITPDISPEEEEATPEPAVNEFSRQEHEALFSSLIALFNKEPSTQFVAMYLESVSIKVHENRMIFIECNQFVAKAISKAKDAVLSDFNQATGYSCTEVGFDQNQSAEANKAVPKPERGGDKPVQISKPFTQKPVRNTRNVYSHTQDRLKKRLLELDGVPLTASQSERYTKEIVYAVEQGSLSKFSITHGINIALKLIHENRWKTPAGYPQDGVQK